MTNERDALEVLVNLIYLIEQHSGNRGKVECFAHQAAGSLHVLMEHFAEPVNKAA